MSGSRPEVGPHSFPLALGSSAFITYARERYPVLLQDLYLLGWLEASVARLEAPVVHDGPVTNPPARRAYLESLLSTSKQLEQSLIQALDLLAQAEEIRRYVRGPHHAGLLSRDGGL